MKKHLLLTIISALSSLFAFAQINLDSGLVACYPFSGNANDLSGNNHHGTTIGPVLTTDRFGSPNSAYLYNGVSDYINLGSYSNIIPSGDNFSLSVWIQASTIDIQTILMINPDDFSDRFGAAVHYNHVGTSSTFWDYGNAASGGRLQIIGTTFSSNWEHYIFIVNSSQNYMEVYKNNVLQLHQNSSSMLVNRNRDLRIGGAIDVNNAEFFFNGKIDDMRLYNRVLSSDEMETLNEENIACAATAVEDLDAPSEFIFFPTISNNGIFYIKFNASVKNMSINVFDIVGQKVKSVQYSNVNENNKIDFSGFSKGIYFLNVSYGNSTRSVKFVIE